MTCQPGGAVPTHHKRQQNNFMVLLLKKAQTYSYSSQQPDLLQVNDMLSFDHQSTFPSGGDQQNVIAWPPLHWLLQGDGLAAGSHRGGHTGPGMTLSSEQEEQPQQT
jgi:hypothetical protein